MLIRQLNESRSKLTDYIDVKGMKAEADKLAKTYNPMWDIKSSLPSYGSTGNVYDYISYQIQLGNGALVEVMVDLHTDKITAYPSDNRNLELANKVIQLVHKYSK